MKISTKGRYALRLMLDLATEGNGKPVSIKDIAGRQDISEKYLEQIISSLNRAGYVKSVRGSQGGYLISFSFHTIPKGNHLPIHIQKLMRQVSLHCHNHLHCKLVWQSRKVLQVSLQSDESGCRELYTLEILCLFHVPGEMWHFLQARKVFQ